MVSRAAQGAHLFRWICRQPRAAPAQGLPGSHRPGPDAVRRSRRAPFSIRVRFCCRTAMTSVDTPRPVCLHACSEAALGATPARPARLARTADKAAVRQSFRWHNPQCAPGHRRCRSSSQASPAGSRPTKCHRPRYPVTGHSLHLIPKFDRPQSLRRWLRPDRCRLTLR